MKKSVVFITLLIILSSCGVCMQTIMGINTPRAVRQDALPNMAKEYGIKEGELYALDTQSFRAMIRSIPNNPLLKHDLGQPLHVMTFDNAGNQITHIVNCYCGGALNLNWSACLKLDSFPLSSRTGARVDTSLGLSEWKSYFRLLDNSTTHSPASEWSIVIFWNRWMGKQSRNLIREIQDYQSRYTQKNIALLWVNTDNLYVK